MRKCIRSRSPTPRVSKAHNFFSRGDNLFICFVLYTMECWLQDQVDRKSFHNPIIKLKDTFFEPAVGSRPNFNRMCG